MKRIIRKAVPDDASVLIDFNSAMAKETEGITLQADRIANGVNTLLRPPSLGFYLLAEEHNATIGTLTVTTEWSDWRNGLFWWIQSVYVKEANRRQGVFRDLHQRITELAEGDSTICGFRLYVERENQTAQKTYKSLGLAETHYKLFEQTKGKTSFFC